MERTLVLLKPDAVRRKLIGEIVARFEKKGLTIKHLKIMTISKDVATVHYEHVKDRPFFKDMIDYITSSPVVGIILEGESVVSVVRTMIGKTNPLESPPGTIRGDYGFNTSENLIHASDSVENAEIEIKRFFSEV